MSSVEQPYALAELRKPVSRRDYSKVHGRMIHALDRKGLYGLEGRGFRRWYGRAGSPRHRLAPSILALLGTLGIMMRPGGDGSCDDDGYYWQRHWYPDQ